MVRDSAEIRVKICGITRAHDARAAVEAGVDALGFVFHAASPRYVTPEQAASIIRTLPPFICTVGVFVNRGREEIEDVANMAKLHVIQLHGEETPEDCAGLSRPVIKAVRFADGKPFPDPNDYAVSGLLVDARVKGVWGGAGVPVDWEGLAEYVEAEIPVLRSRLLLAGGLNPENIARAASLVKPYAVDVSSGVEDEPGIKNHQKIKEFMNALCNRAGPK
jgi:phosphoribosylanthranilate isomerase